MSTRWMLMAVRSRNSQKISQSCLALGLSIWKGSQPESVSVLSVEPFCNELICRIEGFSEKDTLNVYVNGRKMDTAVNNKAQVVFFQIELKLF